MSSLDIRPVAWITPGDPAVGRCGRTRSSMCEHDVASWLNVGRASAVRTQSAKDVRAARGSQRVRTELAGGVVLHRRCLLVRAISNHSPGNRLTKSTPVTRAA